MRLAALALIATLVSATAADAAEPYYQRYSIIIRADQSAVIPLPASDVPVNFDISVRFDDPTLRGLMVASFLITRNSQTGVSSWIATTSGNSLSVGDNASGGRFITGFRAPSSAPYASFEIQNSPPPRIKLRQFPLTGAAKGYYTVTVSY